MKHLYFDCSDEHAHCRRNFRTRLWQDSQPARFPRRLLLSFLLAFASMLAHARDGRVVKGSVVDGINHEPLPGVTVTQRSGQPGSDAGTIRIRGVGTLNDSNPLVLIDGVQGDLVVKDNVHGRYPSDHYFVTADVVL